MRTLRYPVVQRPGAAPRPLPRRRGRGALGPAGAAGAGLHRPDRARGRGGGAGRAQRGRQVDAPDLARERRGADRRLPAAAWTAPELALRRSVLPQSPCSPSLFPGGQDVVGAGPVRSWRTRTTRRWRRRWRPPRRPGSAGRPFSELSGGERWRSGRGRTSRRPPMLRHQERPADSCRERAAAGDAVAVVLRSGAGRCVREPGRRARTRRIARWARRRRSSTGSCSARCTGSRWRCSAPGDARRSSPHAPSPKSPGPGPVSWVRALHAVAAAPGQGFDG
ncbi:hypothetical protein SMICM304S_09457 [Streptomyces microflavus]